MEYNSQMELYKSLLPVFNVKKRLLNYEKYNVKNKDIWAYLANSKWRYDHNLTISEMTNDIINLDGNKLIAYIKGEKQWKKEN